MNQNYRTMDKLTAYKKFIENCTKSPKSVNNYTDFKKINIWINYVDPSLTDILSIDSPVLAANTLEKLLALETMPGEKQGVTFKGAGNAQYYNAFTTYIMFLNAMELSNDLKYDNSDPNLEKKTPNRNLPLQQIFYGAPGTGKSHTVDGVCEQYKHYRTTFHPDSDYSTFVGCYKPTKETVVGSIKSKETLRLEFDSLGEVSAKKIVSFVGLNYPSFSSNQIVKEDWKYIFQKASDSENTINAYVPLGLETAGMLLEKKGTSADQITYNFTPQSFTNAYLEAWKKYANNESVFLVIEEINRGNCAQIFGDLFQLLDRNSQGYSCYPIQPDTDLGKYIEKDGKLNVSGVVLKGKDISKDINTGKVLVLPPNLYIWATMNTSDQSLFPIDSAFKRRWDWKYTPISDAGEGFHIDVNGNSYDWWSFLEKVNVIVEEMTSSEDKQLGYFFCKTDDGVISAEKFVGKVIFYLWNDVFKDYGFDRDEFKYDENGGKKPLTFRKFFKADGTINEEMAEKFLTNLGLTGTKNFNQVVSQEEEVALEKDGGKKEGKHDFIKAVTLDGFRLSTENMTHFDVYLETLRRIGIAQAAPLIESCKFKRKNCPLASTVKYGDIENASNYSYVEEDGYYFVKGAADETLINVLNMLKTELSLELEIEIYR